MGTYWQFEVPEKLTEVSIWSKSFGGYRSDISGGRQGAQTASGCTEQEATPISIGGVDLKGPIKCNM
jgi:hypothetical protein